MDAAPNNNPDPSSDDSSPKSSLARLVADLRKFVGENRQRALLTLAGLTVAMGGTFYVWTYLAEAIVPTADPPSLKLALRLLDDGEFAAATATIGEIQKQDRLLPEEFGGPMFVLGAIKALEAQEETSSDRKRASYVIASRYLEDAYSRGFPAGRRPQGLLLLGESLTHSGRYADSIPILERALAENPAAGSLVHLLLAEAHLQTRDRDLAAAQRHYDAYATDTTLSVEEQLAALRGRIDIRLQRDLLVEARQLWQQLAELDADSTTTSLLKGRLQLAEAAAHAAKQADSSQQELAAKIAEAIESFRATQQRDQLGGSATREAAYLTAKASKLLGGRHLTSALEQFSRTRKLHPDTSAGLAASLDEALLLQESDDSAQALPAFRRTIDLLATPTPRYSHLLSRLEAEQKLRQALASYIRAREFDHAIDLVDMFARFLPAEDAIRAKATTLLARAEAALDDASTADKATAEQLQHVGRAYFREAGVLYEQLSEYSFERRDYTDDLWNSADAFLRGHSFTNAIRLLEEYLDNQVVLRRPAALVSLGEAHLSAGNLAEAVTALEECIEFFEEDASVYRARILCAKAYRQLGQDEQAERLLLANLQGDRLTPSSHEWRDSLFELGFLHHAKGNYDEAIRVLKQAIQRYGDSPQSLVARYFVAEAFRQAAQDPLQRLRAARSENEKQKNRALVREYLGGAVQYFADVQQQLTLATAEGDLTPLENALLRNCYLMRGSAYFDMRQFEESLEVYRNLSSLYQNDPIVLEAYVQIANCHRRLNRPVEARQMLQQAQDVLRRMPTDIDFTKSTSLTAEEWQRLLNQMAGW